MVKGGRGGKGEGGERGKGAEQQISNKVKNYLIVHLSESGIV